MKRGKSRQANTLLGPRHTTCHCRPTTSVVILAGEHYWQQGGPTADTSQMHGMACRPLVILLAGVGRQWRTVWHSPYPHHSPVTFFLERSVKMHQILSSIDLFLSYRTDSTDSRTI